MSFESDLDKLIEARFTLLLLSTFEESRAIESVLAMSQIKKRTLISWDSGDGFQQLSGTKVNLPPAPDARSALDFIGALKDDAVFLLKDFDEHWSSAQGINIRRKLRNLAQRFRTCEKSIIVLAVTSKIPDQLRDETYLIEYPLPQAKELENVLEMVEKAAKKKAKLTSLGKEKLMRAALGLSSSQALRCFSQAMVSYGEINDTHIALVSEQKRQVIRESEALEFFPVSETADDVGGLENLKEWLRMREKAFTEVARSYGLSVPKGVALIGIPGTGKSLVAKVISSMWKMPLLRLDTGALFGGIVGESEERTRRALHVAETISPCVLWIDEIEKAFGGGDRDGGTSSRVFGSILTWMQEKKKPCFIVATANDVSKLPPEMLRRGRFDEIFFLDLPNDSERREIFCVHLHKRKREPREFDLEALVENSNGYVGSEIEQAINDAMFFGFNENQREFTTGDLLKALSRQIPLSRSQREAIADLRRMLEDGRAQSASFGENKEATAHYVTPFALTLGGGGD